jgi:acyl-CoA synthetase (AMP-forming)/AMP-acid ligase II
VSATRSGPNGRCFSSCRARAQLVGQEILAFLAERVAKWWLPDDVVVLDQLPHTATGKLWKADVRECYREHWIQEPQG